MIKVLVIGMGQLGKCIKDSYVRYVKSLDGNNPSFVIDFATNEPETEDVMQLDITNKEQFKEFCDNGGYKFIINCAAYTNVNAANTKAGAQLSKLINRDALVHMADWCESNACNLVHISTDYVFSGRDGIMKENDQSFHPLSIYGKTKKEGEDVIPKYMGVSGKYMIIRTSSLYSQYGTNFVLTMLNKFHNNEDVTVIVDGVSSPTNANDLADCIVNHIILKTITGEREIKNGAYHFTNEGCISWYDFAQEILEQYNRIGGASTSQVFPTDTPTMMENATANGGVVAERPVASMVAKDKFKSEGYNIRYWKQSLIEYFNTQLHTEDYGIYTVE